MTESTPPEYERPEAAAEPSPAPPGAGEALGTGAGPTPEPGPPQGLGPGGRSWRGLSAAGDDAEAAAWPGPSAEDSAPRKRPAAWGLYRLRRGASRGFKLGLYPAMIASGVAAGSALGIGAFAGFGDRGLGALLACFVAFYVPMVFGVILFTPIGALLDWGLVGPIAGIWALAKKRPRGPAPSLRPRWRRMFKRAGAAFVVPALLAFAGGALLVWRVEGRWRALVAESDAADPTWRLDRLTAAREPVADEENGALVVAEACDRIPADPGSKNRRTLNDVLARLERCPADLRFDDAFAVELAAALEPYREAVEVARKLVDCPTGRTDAPVGPAVFDTQLGHLNKEVLIAQALQGDSALRAHRGEADEALASCAAMLGAARSVGDEPSAVAQLARSDIADDAVAAARRVLGQEVAGDEALEDLQFDLADECDYDGDEAAIRGEWAMILEYLDRLAEGRMRPIRGSTLDRSYRTFLNTPQPWLRLWAHFQAIPSLERRNALLTAAAPEDWAFNRMIAIAEVGRTPFAPSLPAKLAPYALAVPSSLGYQPDDITTRLLHRKAELGALVALIAVERYRLKYDEWPESIEDVDPEEFGPVPLDPMDGRDYALVGTDDGVLVYSYGFNGEDDEGETSPDLWTKGVGSDDAAAEAWDVPLRGRVLEGESP